MRRALVMVALAVSVGCGAVRARPSSLADAAAAAAAPSAREAAELAPTSFAEAEGYRREAEEAQRAGDSTTAQILGERAVAAYVRAFIHARSVRAEKARDAAKLELTALESELARVTEEEGHTAAEVAAIETKIKVAKDALPLAAIGASDPAREAARLEAGRALLTEARLLCVATKLVAKDAAGLAEAEAALPEVEKALLATPKAVPIDRAMTARAACLAALMGARRAVTRSPGVDAGDQLLSELSREGTFAPVRDDRGIVISIDAPFTGADISKPAQAKIELAGKIAAAHPTMPLLVVLHDEVDGGKAALARDTQRGEAVKKALGATKAEVVLAGGTRPLVDPKKAKDRARNERLEIVFVD